MDRDSRTGINQLLGMLPGYVVLRKNTKTQKHSKGIVMKWIKVEDRLPGVDVNVIALTSNGKVMVTSMYIPKDCRGKVLGKAAWHGSSTVTASITHWMYIELPKE